MAPELKLQYSSSGGPSPYGFGWDLPIGRIERSSKWGVPRCPGGSSGVDYHDDDFVLILPGVAAELVNVTEGTGYTYRPKIEQSYVQAQRVETDADGDGDLDPHWVVRDRAGLKYVFGDAESARTGTDIHVFMEQDPDGTCRMTTSWALTRIEDPNGNSIDIGWMNIVNVLYPTAIHYGGNSAATPAIQPLYQIYFGYEFRPDWLVGNRTGVQTQLFLRLASIQVSSLHVDPPEIIRTYDIHYDQSRDNEPEGYRSILAAVEVTGTTNETAYPTQQFLYTTGLSAHEQPPGFDFTPLLSKLAGIGRYEA
jgi:hypothetical protein